MSDRELCRYCRKPIATDAEYAVIPEGDGAWLCWSPWQGCDQDAEEAIDLRDVEIGRLERELEQERQDRKQADLDTIRALGERNDARAEVALWKKRIIPFLAVHAGNYGRDHYGENCLHFTHYDMLAEAGGRMDDFKRCGADD